MGLGPLGAVVAISIALVAMYYSMKFFGSLFGKENDNDWVGLENIGFYDNNDRCRILGRQHPNIIF